MTKRMRRNLTILLGQAIMVVGVIYGLSVPHMSGGNLIGAPALVVLGGGIWGYVLWIEKKEKSGDR